MSKTKKIIMSVIGGAVTASSVFAPSVALAEEETSINQNVVEDEQGNVVPETVKTPEDMPEIPSTPDMGDKPEVKPEIKPDEKPQEKPEEKEDQKEETQEETKEDVKEETKEESKDESKETVDEKPSVKPEEDHKSDSKENKTEPKNETKTETKVSSTKSSSSSSVSYDSVPSYESNTNVRHYADQTTEDFIASIGEEARQIGQEKGLYASVMIAQAILESGSGKSKLAQAPYNNLFGIKGSWTDEDGEKHSVSFNTQEDDGTGRNYTIRASFRAYNTTADSLNDYAELLTNKKTGMGNYYKGALKENTKDYKEACRFLQGRYATSTSYAASLESIISTYDLTRYDKKLDYAVDAKIKDEKSELADKNGMRQMTMNDYIKLEALATSYLGTPYVWGGSSPDGFDCSGLVQYTYKHALGINLPRTSYTQQNVGTPVKVDAEELRLGDLLFFSRNGDVHHVAMYLGDGRYIHAPKPGDVVRIGSIDKYKPTFAKRVLNFKSVPVEKEADNQ